MDPSFRWILVVITRVSEAFATRCHRVLAGIYEERRSLFDEGLGVEGPTSLRNCGLGVQRRK